MLNIHEAIVVEGRYDKIKLETLVNTEIFTTDGFGIFKNAEKMELLRRVAEKRGLIVLTDSDGAGLVIRNRLRQCIPEEYLKHAYIPDIPGKEKRKRSPSKAGTLGVEGVDADILRGILERCGAAERRAAYDRLTKADFCMLGLSGASDAAEKRKSLQSALSLPANLSANALLTAVNALYTRDEFLSVIKNL